MTDFILPQIDFARKNTLKAFDGLTEEMAKLIPPKFNNHILWNLGHIYVVQERIVFQMAQEQPQFPEGYVALFANGTKPADWATQPPSLAELNSLLAEQVARITGAFKNRLSEVIAVPFTTASGITLSTIGALINFTAYHEGMHISTIRSYKRLLT